LSKKERDDFRVHPVESLRFDGPVRLDRDVELPGLWLHFQDWPGERGPIICLPGQTANGRTFGGLASALAPEWRVMALDPRGRGRSAKPRHGYGYQVHVADTMALLDLFGFEHVVLAGHSYGAVIGLLIAAWYPERVAGLILIDGGTVIQESTREAVQLIVDRLETVYPSLEAYLGLLRMAPWFQPWTPELEIALAASVEEVPGGVRALTPKWAAEQEIRAYRTGPPDYAALQRAVRCPTLVMRATGGFLKQDDYVLPPDAYREMLDRIPRARGIEVPGANHYTVLLGKPEGTIEAVRNFLAELSSQASQ
jgi:pimeloyl-ACP methyl ester carboxylesterase